MTTAARVAHRRRQVLWLPPKMVQFHKENIDQLSVVFSSFFFFTPTIDNFISFDKNQPNFMLLHQLFVIIDFNEEYNQLFPFLTTNFSCIDRCWSHSILRLIFPL